MRWKWILSIVFVLTMVITLIFYAIVSRYDFNAFKPTLVQTVKKATGRELTLAGDITLAMGLRPALIIENVGLQNAPWGSRPQMATIKRLHIQVAVFPLFSGFIEVTRLILLEPDILIETNKTGNSNLEFAYARADAAAKSDKTESREPGAVLSALLFNEVRIHDGRLAYKDGGSGRIYDIGLNQLTLVKETEQRIRLALKGYYNGKSCQVKGSVGRLASLVSPSKAWPITLTAQTPSTSVAVDGHIQDLFKFKQLELTVSGQGQSVPALLGFFHLTDVPEMGPFSVAGRLMDPEGRLMAKDLAIAIGDEALARVTVAGAIEDLAALKGLDLVVRGRGQSVPDVVRLFAESDIPDMGAFTVTGNLTDPTGALTVTGLGLELNKKDVARIRLSGEVKDIVRLEGLEFDFAAEGPELGNLEQILQRPLPPGGPFRISGHVLAPSKKVITCSNLKVALAQSDLAGSLTLDLEGTRPHMTASLSADRLDVRPHLTVSEKESAENKAEQTTQRKKKVFSDKPLPLEILHQADADMEIRAKTAILPFLALENMIVRFIVDDGHMALAPLKGQAGDGTFASRVDLHSSGQETKAGLVLKTVKLDLGRMLKDLGIEGVLEGKLDVDIDVTSHGDSVAGLMAGLNGSAVAIMEQGKINEKFVGLLSGDPRGLLNLLGVSQKDTSYRDINCLVVGLDIDNGLAKTTALVLDTSAANVVGRGEVDLASEKLHISLKPTPKTGVGIKGLGKLSVSLGELTKTLKVGGTLASPSLAIDPSGTAITLGKAIGGAVLLGPVGIAAALAGANLGDKNPCPLAIDAARTAMVKKRAPVSQANGGDNQETGDGPGKSSDKRLSR